MKITVIGSGYVGLVTAACFADMGNHLTCVDVDENKLNMLKNGKVPIYEPGLEEKITTAISQELMFFTSNLAQGLEACDVAFIAVGTPPNEDGSADLRHVLAVAKSIGQTMENDLVVVDKSTVPVGTAEKVHAVIQEELDLRGVDLKFHVVSNPEFLKEGAALDDFMKPDRIIIGTDSLEAEETMRELYRPFSRHHDKIIVMGVKDAEMTKYAANAMLATKISFMNEMAGLCEEMGVDVEQVRRGIGSDQRIGFSFIYPGCGYGGSCFPKDVKAVIQMGESVGFNSMILDAVENRNALQKLRLFEKLVSAYGDIKELKGKTFCVWGLAFKPGTDDMREAPSIPLIKSLVDAGAKVHVFDPVAQTTARIALEEVGCKTEAITFFDTPYEAAEKTDGLLLVTEWKLFQQPNFVRLSESLNRKLIIDGRNLYNPSFVKAQGFEYYGIGR